MAGYSGRALVDKLGVKPGARVALIGAPEGFESALEPLPAGATVRRRLSRGTDLAVMFTMRRAELARRWVQATRDVGPMGVLWVAWPKKASGVVTDMNEHAMREVVLPTGWVDVKVCAIDDTWTGMKCVLRLERRPS
jgi:hypothetical protein